MKNASFAFMVYNEDLSVPLSNKQGPLVETESGEEVSFPVINLHTNDLEEIRAQAHFLVDRVVNAALNQEAEQND